MIMSEDDIVSIVRNRLKIRLDCPECKEYVKLPIQNVKFDCSKCGHKFEKNIEECEGYYNLSLLIPKGLVLEKFRTMDDVKLHFNDYNKSRATDIINAFKESIGLDVGEEKLIKVKDKDGRTITINEIPISKTEFVKYFKERK